MSKELIEFLTELSNEKTLFFIHPRYKRKATELLNSINSAQSESLSDRDNEQKENNCLLNLPKGDCVTKNSFKYCPVSCRWRQL